MHLIIDYFYRDMLACFTLRGYLKSYNCHIKTVYKIDPGWVTNLATKLDNFKIRKFDPRQVEIKESRRCRSWPTLPELPSQPTLPSRPKLPPPYLLRIHFIPVSSKTSNLFSIFFALASLNRKCHAELKLAAAFSIIKCFIDSSKMPNIVFLSLACSIQNAYQV